jgi:hypothetical protein
MLNKTENTAFVRSINDFFNTFELYYILIITIVGLIGNSISFLMFVFSKLR